ncbi:HET-domain-containing protein [Stipitochalara longipes BDJ]|nr:HET-domain-containing protein [Stipitochalara longipes BDJ]
MDSARSLQGQADSCQRRLNHVIEFSLPTRLIDVSPDSETGTPRLVLSANLGEVADCRYTALSHCWGGQGKVPRTLRDTLVKHQEGITGLSKTFEDAVEVTRQIGVRYLWIDSLCIIQDEANDFQKECSRMSLVYAGSYCMLSAADAEDGSGGLFIPRTSLDLQNLENPVNSWTSLLKGPLGTRGWAFQEYQLSPRIVHFTKTRIFWECRACVAFEDFPSLVYRGLVGGGDLDNSWSSGKQRATWRLFDRQYEICKKNNMAWTPEIPRYPSSIQSSEFTHSFRKDAIHTRWLRAAESYSSRNLTYEADKLPAISGLAATIAGLLKGDVYLAGIWEKDLIRGLLWISVPGTAVAGPKRIPYPSWSWASYCGRIHFLGSMNDGHKYIDSEIELLTESFKMRSNLRFQNVARIKARTAILGLDPFGLLARGSEF